MSIRFALALLVLVASDATAFLVFAAGDVAPAPAQGCGDDGPPPRCASDESLSCSCTFREPVAVCHWVCRRR
jgi:hypothetical protein